MLYEQPLLRKLKEAILEDKERIWDDHDREISNIQKQNKEKVVKSFVLGLVIGGGVAALATSFLTLYIHALNKH